MHRHFPLYLLLSSSLILLPHVAGADEDKIEVIEGVTLTGLIEVEATYTEQGDNDDSESDIAVSTVEIGVQAQVNPWVSADILLKYEDGDDDEVFVDEAFITLGNPTVPYSLQVGRLYVPFGKFETQMVSDPITLDLAEAREDALQVNFEQNGIYASAYVFNGDTQKSGSDNNIDQYGANLGYKYEGAFNADVGIAYINNIADSGGITDNLPDAEALADYVAGFDVYGMVEYQSFQFMAEYISALDNFALNEFAFDGKGAEPKAWHAEIAYTTTLGNKETTFALGYDGTDEAVGIGLPESRILGAVTVGIYENTSLALEWARSENYGTKDGGDGEDSNAATLFLAVEF